MSSTVPELSIVGEDDNLFTRGDQYEIPLYQRPYTWNEGHIERLIEDVDDITGSGKQRYCLGSLVVSQKRDSLYEVIDGQQRLTTLYLLLSALEVPLTREDAPPLIFSCREKSNYTLAYLSALNSPNKLEEKHIDQSIARGMKVVQQKLASFSTNDLTAFKRKLKRTYLYRIEVPEHTDLNRYFEIMNTRGEQLEQHEVLKARLMEPLSGDAANKFAAIWDACSDMSCYVQTRFDTSTRERLFGWRFDEFPTQGRIRSIAWHEGDSEAGLRIEEIISEPPDAERKRKHNDDESSRFESIIDFRFFLLHTLKVFVETRGIASSDPSTPIVASLLDDKKLGASFDRVLKDGLWNGQPVDRPRFSLEFVECLLQTRFLFDKCIIKREFASNDLEGKWSLKELKRATKKSYRYVSTKFKRTEKQQERTLANTNRNLLMIESCLRVSYTSPKAMHWITDLLVLLSKKPELAGAESFARSAENYVQNAVREFLREGDFSQGINTPHIALNYLDYLLWRKKEQRDDDHFTFEFRTSVEHWYPQNPSSGTFEKWDKVNRFGNLCLVQRNVNSKFSNLDPVAKKSTYQEMIAKGSLKLREMALLTSDANNWKVSTCQKHEAEMLTLLRKACGLKSDD